MGQTFGQESVGLQFNPSGDDEVTKVKQLYADVIDKMYDLQRATISDRQRRYCAIAITQAEIAQMSAVKALTWKDPAPDEPMDFDDVVIGPSMTVPVLVDFYLESCQPCLQVAPELGKIAHEFGISLVKIDAKKQPAIAQDFSVRGVPRLLIFHGGVAVWDTNTAGWRGPDKTPAEIRVKLSEIFAGIK